MGKWWIAGAVRLPHWLSQRLSQEVACWGWGLCGHEAARDAAVEMARELLAGD